MFALLPESASHHRRDPAGVAWSATVHLGVAALVAIASTDVGGPPAAAARPDTALVYLPPPPPAPTGPARDGGGETGQRARTPLAPRLPSAPITVPISIPPVDPFAPSIDETATQLADHAGRVLNRAFEPGTGSPVAAPHRLIYEAVERAAVALPGNPTPDYPAALLAAGIEGSVLVELIVDTTGRVEPSSVRIVESDHALFESAVRAVLPRMRFAPAEAGGRRVRQWVRQPFEFHRELRPRRRSR